MDTNNKEKDISNNQNSKKRGIVTLAIVIAVVLTVIFSVYKFYFGNSKKIITNSIDTLSGRWERLLEKYADEDDYGENYTIKSSLKIDAVSDTLETLATTAPEYEMYNNIVKNLKRLNTDVVVSQSKKDEKMLMQIDSKLQDEDLINIKFLVQDNKQYYLVKGLFDNYVDGGENKYFDTLEENKSSMEDIKYVYDIALKSLKKNLKDEYFTNENEKIKVDGKEINARKVILTIDDKAGRELAKAILKDLKDSKEATRILEKVSPNFKDAKVDDDTEIFGDDSKICYIAYVDKLTYNNLMQKIEIYSDGEVVAIAHEETKKKDKDALDIYENDSLMGTITMEEKKDGYSFELLDGAKQNIGTINISKKGDQLTTGVDMVIENMKITFNMKSKKQEIKKEKEYTVESNMNLKIESEQTQLVELNIDVDSSITTNAKIEEDIKNAVSGDSVNSEKLQEYMTNIILKLAS